MAIARLLILTFWMGFSVPCFCTAHLGSPTGKVTGDAAEAVQPKAIVEARSLAILVHSHRRVQVTDAIIRGPLDLSYMTIDQQVSLVNCEFEEQADFSYSTFCLLYTSPSPRDRQKSRMPSSA